MQGFDTQGVYFWFFSYQPFSISSSNIIRAFKVGFSLLFIKDMAAAVLFIMFKLVYIFILQMEDLNQYNFWFNFILFLHKITTIGK